MKLEQLLAALGLRRSALRPRTLVDRSRRLLVESLEDRSLMAVADLIAYRPVTEYIDYSLHRVPEAVENCYTLSLTPPCSALGPGIRVNGDDDNGNQVPDYSDSVPSPSADNDLVRVDATGSGTSFAVSWTGSLAVWTTPTKSAAVSNGSSVAPNQSLWIEYVSQTQTVGSNTALTLTVNDATSTPPTTATDSVTFHSFQSVVIAIGGNSQDPKNFGDPLLGTFTMAGALYDKGYDVHMYSHDQIQSNGQGAAYNEVKSAILARNVDYVAIVGYSWGGGATYELSAGLNNTTALKGQYTLQYTAYVDGIRHYSLSAETRLPVGTQYHDNFYQRKDWLLRGNSVVGANNVNVTLTSWGKNLVHTTIDDNATLQNLIVTNLITRVIA